MGINVLVIIAGRQFTQLPAETLATGIIFTRCAITITPPIPERVDQQLELVIVGKDGAALAHGDVVGGIEAECANIAKSAYLLIGISCAQSIATIFDQPQAMLMTQRGHDFEIEGVAQGMREHDGLGLGRDGGLDPLRIDVIGGDMDIHEYRHSTEL